MQKKYRFVSLLLLLLSFSACGDVDEVESEYNDTNIIAGIWNNYYGETDSLVMTRVFTSDRYSYFSYAEGKEQDEQNKSKYYLDETKIYLEKYIQTYKLVTDTLWITNSKGDQTTKYIRSKTILSDQNVTN
ncbi:hypothetical protein [Dysgonomonas macrotermitis]|uniref:Lipocalin-like domain-containing protein n=1 Tax=Dysgonomonas macrotermitis TaxID=1346286 RepID=A0A1M5F3L5_9BACT|nr:hypothetical protein [Dysgonomonas macrotermitis]SHF86133.1 hypothetical protein SAMN05444362_11142 [Dysgonomonas macrotermitis]